jgi:hypothetical protein
VKTENVIGRRIVGVRQHRAMATGGPAYDVDAIVLDNGVELRPFTRETPSANNYIVEMLVVKV